MIICMKESFLSTIATLRDMVGISEHNKTSHPGYKAVPLHFPIESMILC